MTQEALSQQIELCPAVHLPRQGLQVIDVPLRLTVAPILGQAGLDCRFVRREPSHTPAQVGNAAVRGGRDPARQARSLLLTRYRGELARQAIGAGNGWVRCAELVEQRALRGRQRVRVLQTLECDVVRCW